LKPKSKNRCSGPNEENKNMFSNSYHFVRILSLRPAFALFLAQRDDPRKKPVIARPRYLRLWQSDSAPTALVDTTDFPFSIFYFLFSILKDKDKRS
jgi:hypothetical protein